MANNRSHLDLWFASMNNLPPPIECPTLVSHETCGTLYYLSGARIEKKESNVFAENFTSPSTQKTTCNIKKIFSEFPNLLAVCDVDPQFRLYTLLGILPNNTGIANLLNYSHPIDQYTRIMRYQMHSGTQSLSAEVLRDITIEEGAKQENDRTTHVVRSVKFGVEVIVMIQLPANAEEAEQIHEKLELICDHLRRNQDIPRTDTAKLESICFIEIFSNVPGLCKDVRSIRSLLLEIKEFQRDPSQEQQPYCYELHPIGQDSRKCYINPKINKKIEDQLLPLQQIMGRIKTVIDEAHHYCEEHFREWDQDIRQEYAGIEDGFKEAQVRFTGLIERMAHEPCDSVEIDALLTDKRAIGLRRKVEGLFNEVKRWHVKEKCLSKLLSRPIGYLKFNGSHSTQAIESAIRARFPDCKKNVPIICSTDELFQQKEKEFNDRYEKLRREQPTSSAILMIYVDLTDEVLSMDDFEDLKLSEGNDDALSVRSSVSTSSAHSANEEIDGPIRNILVLSSTRADQEQLINMFTQILSFQTYEEVMSNRMNIPVPVTNAILSDENELPSPHCRSYLFKLNTDQNDHRQLRLIITPPLGSAETYTKQSTHVQEIILFLKTYRRLHGICFLLKLNEENFDVQLRHDLGKLLKFFDEEFRHRFLFCSTQGQLSDDRLRTTIRTMRILLQELLNDLVIYPVNSFGFDTEWLQCPTSEESSVRPYPDDTNQFSRSWEESTEEVKRFCRYVFNELDRCQHEQNQFVDSVEKARFEIWLRIPLLADEMGNCWRNILLFEKRSPATKIKISFEHLGFYYAICDECQNQSELCGEFHISVPVIRSFVRDRLECGHSSNNRSLAYYRQKHEQTDVILTKEMKETYKSTFDRLLEISVMCDYFLRDRSNERSAYDVLLKLEKMIEEEIDIQRNYPLVPLQKSFKERLEGAKNNYCRMRDELMRGKRTAPTLTEIFQFIRELDRNETISAGVSSILNWVRCVSADHDHALNNVHRNSY